MSTTWYAGARLVDGTGSDPVDGVDLCVEDGVVTALGPAPAGADVVDLDGATITPGLIDAHVHLAASPLDQLHGHALSVAEIAADMFANAAQTLDAGYTTVRDTGGIDGGLPAAVRAGKVRGPRILQCGPIQCQRGGHGHVSAHWEPTELWTTHEIPGLCTTAMLSDSPDQMRGNVREAFRRGADFLKLCVTGGVVSFHDQPSDTQLTFEEIAVAVAEADARGTYVTVHAHNNRGLLTAIRAGVKCVEHGSEIDEEVAALMAREGVAHVPTLAVVDAVIADAEQMGLPAHIAERAVAVREGQIQGLLASRAAGVVVGLGSDLIGPDQRDRSRELLLRSELATPMDALVAATGVNARVLRIDDRVGTLEVGKVADLVAWRTDPLEDPRRFTDRDNAALVVQGGVVVKDLR